MLHSQNQTDRSPLSIQHRDALRKRGLTDKTIEAAGIWSASAQEASALVGFNLHSGGIVIPFHHPLTGQSVLSRVRPDQPPVINGKPAKYLSPTDVGNRLYFPPSCAELLGDPTVPIGITEGEFKTLWAYQVQLFYIGLIGVWGWRGKNDKGERGPIADLDLIAWQDRSITLCFDSDASTNPKVQQALQALAHELYRRGARIVYNIDLSARDVSR